MKLKDKLSLVITTAVITCIIMNVVRDNREINKLHSAKNITEDIYVTYGIAVEDYGDEFENKDGFIFTVPDPPEFEKGEEVMLLIRMNNTKDTSDDYVVYIDSK